MPISMYEASIPVFGRMLNNLSAILEKAAAYSVKNSIDPSVLVNARLAPDMYPLSRQVQIATDMVKGCTARLAGLEVPNYVNDETTFADLQARIAKTIAFIQTVNEGQINGTEGRTITLKVRDTELSFLGQPYLLNFVLPNLYFHITITYAILRHNGLELGKMDY